MCVCVYIYIYICVNIYVVYTVIIVCMYDDTSLCLKGARSYRGGK